MTSFNDLKNNIQILKKYLTKMQQLSEEQCEINPQWINEKFIKENNPYVFLQIMHYIFIKFSPLHVFIRVLDQYPTIKDDPDKKFITNLMLFSRKFLEIDLKIDSEQFLSQKFLEKKVELLSLLSKMIYQRHLKQEKASTNPNTAGSHKNINGGTANIYGGEGNSGKADSRKHESNRFVENIEKNDTDEEQGPKQLNIRPMEHQSLATKTANNTKKPSEREQVSHPIKTKSPGFNSTHKSKHVVKVISPCNDDDEQSDEQYKELMEKKKRVQQKAKKSNYSKEASSRHLDLQSKSEQCDGFVIKQQNYEEEADRVESRKTVSKVNGSNNAARFQKVRKQEQVELHRDVSDQFQKQQNVEGALQSPSAADYVSRQEFMQIMQEMNSNFSQMIGKFNQFQGQVSGWVQNINAKMSMLEDSVRTIKDNL